MHSFGRLKGKLEATRTEHARTQLCTGEKRISFKSTIKGPPCSLLATRDLLGFLLAGSWDFNFLVSVGTTIRSLKVKLLGGVQKSAKSLRVRRSTEQLELVRCWVTAEWPCS